MTVITWPEPHETQRLFMRDRHRHVGFGGARGGGKSWAVRQKAGRLCVRYPGIRVLIVRRTYRELINNHVVYLQADLKGLARFNKSDMQFKFVNGSTISFGYCNSDNDLMQYQGVEYDVIFLDEATQLQEDWIRKITACCRGANDYPKRIYYTCNPGGVGHAYIKRLFIDRRFEEGEDPEDYSFIQSRVTDNLALMRNDPMYMRTLQALPPKLRKAWLDGDWGIFEGQFFEDFIDRPEHYQDRQWTHVIEPFDVPHEWYDQISIDPGLKNPLACHFYACDWDGNLYAIAEHYEAERDVRYHAERIREIAERLSWHFDGQGRLRALIDSAASQRTLAASQSVAELFYDQGILVDTNVNKDMFSGISRVKQYLKGEKHPRLYIFKNCVHLIREFKGYWWGEGDHPRKQDDHCLDELRYYVMSRPQAPVRKVELTPIQRDKERLARLVTRRNRGRRG